MYLLDSDIVAALRRPRPDPTVVAWLKGIPEAEVYISALTIGELEAGIELARERNEAEAERLTRWLDKLAASRNVLPMDHDAFWLWAKLRHRHPARGFEEAMIAATALLHDLTLVTGQPGDFEAFDVPLLNPFEDAPIEE